MFIGVGIPLTQQQAGAAAPELLTNGDFTTDTSGWSPSNATLSVVSGALKVQNTGSNTGNANQSFPTVIGATYRFTGDLAAGTGLTPKAVIADAQAAGTQLGSVTGPGTGLSFTFVATATTSWLRLTVGDATSGHNVTFDNVSVKAV